MLSTVATSLAAQAAPAAVALTERNVRHLLRRCEIVDRTSRVNELLALGTLEAAVDNVMTAPTWVTLTFTQTKEWERGNEYAEFWINRMAHDSARPFTERMGVFWHSHFCSDLSKVNWAEGMRQQSDLFRRDGLGNIRQLAKDMSVQVAMLRYLDNNENRRTSPNQNFSRELLELFLMGVGNYNEADVEAAAAAWTGHSDQWDDTTSPYRWRPLWHDSSPKQFLGRTINTSGDLRTHAFDTIDVVFTTGVVPADALVVTNRGRRTRDVTAEFLSQKLWNSFATQGAPPPGVLAAMSSALVGSGFEIRPWVKAMLLHPDFYVSSTVSGLVRQPFEFMTALLVATGRRAGDVGLWGMGAMGQALWYPPNVSGWRPNGYWVNAAAATARAQAVDYVLWRSSYQYWDAGGAFWLGYGTLSRAEVTARVNNIAVLSPQAFVDRVLLYCDIRVSPAAYANAVAAATGATVWERTFVVSLLLMSGDMHVA